MNNKDFITALATRLDMTPKEAGRIATEFINQLAEKLDEGNTLATQALGSFEVKKKLERIVVNPNTKQRMLVPPKLVMSFKPSNLLKDKFNAGA